MLWHAQLQLSAAACLAVQAETLQMGGEAVVAAAEGMPDDQLSQTVQDQAAAQAQDLFRRAVQAYEQVCRPRCDVQCQSHLLATFWAMPGSTDRQVARQARTIPEPVHIALCLCLPDSLRVTGALHRSAADCCLAWPFEGSVLPSAGMHSAQGDWWRHISPQGQHPCRLGSHYEGSLCPCR